MRIEPIPEVVAFEVELAGVEGRAETYACGVSVCDNAYCHCSEVTLDMTPANDAARSRWKGRDRVQVILDPFERVHAEDGDDPPRDPLVMKLGRRVATHLKEEQWRRLASSFLAAKRRAIEELDPAEEQYPFEFEAIERGGELIAFQEIFPYADPILLTHKGRKYLFDDQHCVREECSCTDVLVTVHPVTGDDSAGKEVTALRWRDSSQWVDASSGKPAAGFAAELGRALEATRADVLESILPKRRTLLRKVYAESKAYFESPHDPAGDSPDDATARAGNETPRNAPCPCGSGKKFKRCCGG